MADNSEERRFQVGDIVRIKSLSQISTDYHIPLNMHGFVVGVEPPAPQAESTYRIQVQFPSALVPYASSSFYEPATELERRYKQPTNETTLKELILTTIAKHPICPPGMDVSIGSLGDGNWEPLS